MVYLDDAAWREIVGLRTAVADKRDGIQSALALPDMVTQDREASPRQHFYKKSDFPPPYERGWFKVTIEPRRRYIPGNKSMNVIDVAFVNSQPAKEKRIWPSPTPGQLPM